MEDKMPKNPKNEKNEFKSLINHIEKTKKIKKVEEMKDALAEICEKAKTTSISFIQKFIILFYKYYNNTTSNYEKYDKLIQLSNFMIKHFTKKNITLLIFNEINKLFPENKIEYPQDELDEYEICLYLSNSSHNIKIMETFFIEFLNVNLFETDEYSKINIENPNAQTLFENIFRSIYDKNKKNIKENIDIKNIISQCINNSNKSTNNLFRCKKCYDIMIMKLNINNNIEFKCQHCDKEFTEFKEYETLSIISTKFFCSCCKEKLLLYRENYKCTSCKKLVCNNCKTNHLKDCFSLNYIKMYEVGFKCDIHIKNYIEYCFVCKKNICENCKIIHQHKTESLKNIEKEIIAQNYSKSNLPQNQLIKYNIIQLYTELKKSKLFNGFLYEISCELFNIKYEFKYKKDDIYFKHYNNDEFNNYYEKAIKKISKGNLYYLKHLKAIKSFYEKEKINISKEVIVDYDIINNREIALKEFIEKTKSYLKELSNIHRFIDYDYKINNLKKINQELIINIQKINFELLEYRKSNRKLKENTHNILSRFLADELLNYFISNFHQSMDKVAIKLNVFLELILSGNFEILSNDEVINSITSISNEFNEIINKFKQNPKDEKLKSEIIEYIWSSKLSKITFIEDIKIGNEIFKKEDLNAILEFFLLIKNFGNKTVHPNIDISESLKILDIKDVSLEINLDLIMNEINKLKFKNEIFIISQIPIEKKELSKELENDIFIDNIIENITDDEDECLYYNSNKNEFSKISMKKEYNLYGNLNKYFELTRNNIEIKMEELKNEEISRLNENALKKRAKIDEIIDVLFNEDDIKIYDITKNFVGVLNDKIKEVMKRKSKIILEEKYHIEKRNINLILELLELIQMKLYDFEKLKIIKHENLSEYVNKKILTEEDNFYKFILFIEKLESKNFSLFTVDSLGNEIIAEVCFLFLSKLYIIEVNNLEATIDNYEKEIFNNIVYEEISSKIKDIHKLIFESYINETPYDLTNNIKNYIKKIEETNNLSLDKIKIILSALFKKEIDLSKNKKLSLEEKLFLFQNVMKK